MEEAQAKIKAAQVIFTLMTSFQLILSKFDLWSHRFFRKKSRRTLQQSKRNCLPVSNRCKLRRSLRRSSNFRLFHIFDVTMTQTHARIDNFFKNLSHQSHHYATCAHSTIRTIALGTLLTNFRQLFGRFWPVFGQYWPVLSQTSDLGAILSLFLTS